MSAGPETLAPTARGAMLYDASRCGQPNERLFEREHWRRRGALEEAAGGRGTVAFVHDGRAALGAAPLSARRARRTACSATATCGRGADRTRAFREWRLLRELRAAGLPVPAPVAARYVRSGMVLPRRPHHRGAADTSHAGRGAGGGTARAGQWRRIGACIGRLHAHGVHHADLNAHNLLLGDDGTVYVLDFDRGRIRPRGAWEQAVLRAAAAFAAQGDGWPAAGPLRRAPPGRRCCSA